MIWTIANEKTGMARWAKKVLAASLLTAALVTGLLAPPAHAQDTFTVNIPGDTKDASPTDNLCDVNPFAAGKQCTLRAAIEQANATFGADTIRFNIPDDFGSGVKTIDVGATGNGVLPAITERVTIDGYTQPGASPNTLTVGDNAALKIELNGSSAGGGNGLSISSSSGSVIKGLVINRFASGINVDGDSAANRIEGNFIGTDPTGTLDRGNRFNAVAIGSGASENVVGGATPAARNVLSGNDNVGVFLNLSKANHVEGNFIGTKKDGKTALANSSDGVQIFGGTDSTVGDGTSGAANTIAYNGGAGVSMLKVAGSSGNDNGNEVSRNSVFSNDGIGIDLGIDGSTPNDPDDPTTPEPDPDSDSGPNTLQNFPVLSSAEASLTKTSIKGRLNSIPQRSFTVQFFSNPKGADEGKKLLGQKKVSTDSSGKVSFTKALPKVAVGKTITATATGSGGNTSEFSAPKKVVAS